MDRDGEIEGIIIKEFRQFDDNRGWLAELFRSDDPGEYRPEMGYVSLTYPGIVRGPHEHMEQTDYFCFLGTFSLYLWDNRKNSPTYGSRKVIKDADRLVVIVPPGIVHAYKNSGERDGMVLNFPDRLFAGWGRKEKVDEVRYEQDAGSPFKVG
jgi:dTDP-4-dehydrorhamnose 3,5-epimerase